MDLFYNVIKSQFSLYNKSKECLFPPFQVPSIGIPPKVKHSVISIISLWVVWIVRRDKDLSQCACFNHTEKACGRKEDYSWLLLTWWPVAWSVSYAAHWKSRITIFTLNFMDALWTLLIVGQQLPCTLRKNTGILQSSDILVQYKKSPLNCFYLPQDHYFLYLLVF